MSKKVYMNSAAEREATEVGKKFMHSTDVVGDMSRAYGTDLSSVRIHADSSSDRKTAERGVDAFSTGNDIFFARSAFNQNDPASRGLLAHELSHSIQQGVGGEMGGMQHAAPMGAEQGGLIDWFRNLFKKKPKTPNKEDTLDFKIAGESVPEADGRKMNLKQLYFAANRATSTPHKQLMAQLNKDENGEYAGGRTDKRHGLRDYISTRFQGKEESSLMDHNLTNASATIIIPGLNSSRLLNTLTSVTGGSMTNEDVGKMYDNLLSGGNAALYNNSINTWKKADEVKKRMTAGKELTHSEAELQRRADIERKNSVYSEDEIKSRDAKFMTGILQLKGVYLNQLRNMKNKYGTYITQMHPEDFLDKIGMSFYEDFSCMQDVVQLLDYNKTDNKLFDFENNADDREYKQLSDYYFNAYNMLVNYITSDMNIGSTEFKPQTMEFIENENFYTPTALGLEKQIGGPGFNEKEQAGYLKRMQKRFKKEKKSSRLFGRFK